MAADTRQKVQAAQAELDFEKNRYQLVLDTSAGKIRLDLDPQVAPGHVKNLLGLAKIGFYDGGSFHRVIKGFMIQGGCPLGNGTGGPGYTIPAEFNSTPHEAGVVSMARTSDPNSAGSQFFVCLGKHAYLDGQYTAFGRTADAESLAAVKKIGDMPTDSGDRPQQKVAIHSATVVAIPR